MSKTAWVVILVIAVLLVGLTVASWFVPFAFGQNYGYGMMGRGGHMGFGGMMGGWGMMGGLGLVFWALVIIGGIWLFQSLIRGRAFGNTPPAIESPLDILKRRYAKGEITKEQYEALKADIGA